MEPVICVDAVVKSYGSVKALNGVSLSVGSGEIFGFLGPNGAGKSTFVKLLLGLVSPSGGRVELFGNDAGKTAQRRNVGFLPETTAVYPFLTIGEFIHYHCVLGEIPPRTRKQEAQRCLEAVGMIQHARKRLGSLSKGMLQRVCIAQALLGSPQLIILDEPTSGLDPIGIKELRSLLLAVRERGGTVFLSSHLLSEVERTCDRVAILHQGKIIRSGSRSDLTGKERYLEVVAEGVSEQAVQALNRTGVTKPVERDGNRLIVYPGSESHSVDIHRIIVEQGGALSSMCWKGESLEELFYRLVKNG